MMRPLPKFKYHPDPLATGVFEPSEEICDCCGKIAEYIYTPAIYSADDINNLCPWCIESGEAHRKFDATFNPNVGTADNDLVAPWPPVSLEVKEEVEYRTPGFPGYQEEHWWTHCSDAGAFIGYVGDLPKQLFESDKASRFVGEMKKVHQLSDEDWKWLISTADKEHSITFYTFRCLHCEEIGGYGDRS